MGRQSSGRGQPAHPGPNDNRLPCRRAPVRHGIHLTVLGQVRRLSDLPDLDRTCQVEAVCGPIVGKPLQSRQERRDERLLFGFESVATCARFGSGPVNQAPELVARNLTVDFGCHTADVRLTHSGRTTPHIACPIAVIGMGRYQAGSKHEIRHGTVLRHESKRLQGELPPKRAGRRRGAGQRDPQGAARDQRRRRPGRNRRRL